MDDILKRLAEPFPPEIVSWRVGSTNGDKTRGLALAYIDARDVQDRLDAVCGLDWQVRHPWSVNGKLACEIGIRINGEWLWRGDGAGDTDVEAEKGAFSDSFKRAAVRWGIGRYLYDLDSPWVEVDSYTGRDGKVHVKGIKESEFPRLRSLLAGKKAPAANPAPSTKPADEPPEREQARKMYATVKAGIDAATHAGDAALGLKVDGKDREDIAFIRKWGGNVPADSLHTLAAHKIASLTKRNAA